MILHPNFESSMIKTFHDRNVEDVEYSKPKVDEPPNISTLVNSFIQRVVRKINTRVTCIKHHIMALSTLFSVLGKGEGGVARAEGRKEACTMIGGGWGRGEGLSASQCLVVDRNSSWELIDL